MQAQQQELTAAERPLVVVIEEAEAVDTLTLQDLILVLSEVSSAHMNSTRAYAECLMI